MRPFKIQIDHPEKTDRFVLDTSRRRTTVYDFETRTVVFDQEGTGKVNRTMAEEEIKKILVAEKAIRDIDTGGIIHG